MNTNLIMYNRCIHQLKNDPNLYIVNDLFKDSSWIKYKNFYNTTYQGILNYLLEMSLVTRIAYTYYMSGEEVYEISPYYIKSLYQEMNFDDKFKRTKRHEKTIHQFKTSKILKKYLTIDELGHSFIENNKIVYSTTKYRINDLLKDLSKHINVSDFCVIDVRNLSNEKGKISFISKRPKELSNTEYYLQLNGLYSISFNDLNSNNFYSKDHFSDYDLTNSILVNRKNIEKYISNPNIYKKYSPFVVYELKKIYNSTDEYNNKYNLYYHKTSCGRYYCKESSIQMFPRELRKDILSNYTEIDMNSSIFSLYINLAKMYDYTGNISEINEFTKNSKKYRMNFVTDKLSYDDVKKVLTALAYGARTNIYNMYLELYNSEKKFHKNAVLNCAADKMSIINMVSCDKIQELIREIHSIGKFLFKLHLNENKKIENLYGNVIESKSSFGKKLSHIMQSYESKILIELTNSKINGIKLKDIENSIGLYLHDGIYVNNDIVKNNDICSIFSNHVKDVMGFEVKYSID